MCLQLPIYRVGGGEIGDGIHGSNSGLSDPIGGDRGLASGKTATHSLRETID